MSSIKVPFESPRVREYADLEGASPLMNSGPESNRDYTAEWGNCKKPILKSPADTREYRPLLLDNKMRVLLISDPTSEKAAASLTVACGSLNDRKELPGLAHFCEHMLFMGTTKYPVENDYGKYLSDNGGSSNAYTADDNTNFYFDVAPESLNGALDRFSQFFINPLFTESATEREINAVHSEHEKNIPDDTWRMARISKIMANPEHPYSNFGTGNRDTLWVQPKEKSINIRDELFEYHGKYYSANLMTLCVLGKQSLDELETMVDQFFSPVVNKNAPLEVWHDNPYTEKELGSWVNLVPVKELRGFYLIFPCLDTENMYETGSTGYVIHLLGHEGAGSLLSFLKKKGWVTGLSGSVKAPGRGFSMIKVAFDLTEEGLDHVQEIVTHLFQYLEMLRRSETPKWLWDERRDVKAMRFQFLDKSSPQSYVSFLSPRMLDYPVDKILSAGYINTGFKPDEITNILDCLKPDNCLILLITKENTARVNLVEEYYGIQYSVERIDPNLIQKWTDCGVHEALHLPARNEFIPTVFDLKPRLDWGLEPRLISNGTLSRVWFLQDNEFKQPKAVIGVEIYSLLPLVSPLNAAVNGMLERMILDNFCEYGYSATMAGLGYTISSTYYGLQVWVTGFDQHAGTLLVKILAAIINFTCDPQRFEVLKDVFTRDLQGFNRAQPKTHANCYLDIILLKQKIFTPQEILNVLEDVTPERLTAYAKELVSEVKLEWFIYGNLTEADANELVVTCESMFEANGVQALSLDKCIRVTDLKLKEGSDFLYTQDHHHHSDSCAAVFFQGGPDSTKENVLISLLDQITEESCFDQLRSKEQLGYIVGTGVRNSNGCQGFMVIVQGSKHPRFVESRIDSYLQTLFETLQTMTEEEFLQNRTALSLHMSVKPKQIWTRAALLWSEISSRELKFTRVQDELQELENISREDLLNYFTQLIGPERGQRRRISIHIVSKTKDGAGSTTTEQLELVSSIERNTIEISDIEAWKASHEFFAPTTNGI